jgi:hypothetical protein
MGRKVCRIARLSRGRCLARLLVDVCVEYGPDQSAVFWARQRKARQPAAFTPQGPGTPIPIGREFLT